MPRDHWNRDNWEICFKSSLPMHVDVPPQTCAAQTRFLFLFSFLRSTYKRREKEEGKVASETLLGLGSFAGAEEEERGCEQTRSRDLQGQALDASVGPGNVATSRSHRASAGCPQVLREFLKRQNIFLAD